MGQVEENYVWLLGCNVSFKLRWMQFFICGGGFFFGYMINGVCEVCVIWGVIWNLMSFDLNSGRGGVDGFQFEMEVSF